MTRQESLDILNEVNRQLDSMTQKEIFDHMCSTSSAYRSYIYDIISNFGEDNIYGHDFMNLPDDFPDENEVKTERYNNTVRTNAGNLFTWGDPNVHSENVNKIRPEDVHLDRIDNKADERTPISIKVDHTPEDKYVISVTEKNYNLIKMVLDDYKRLLYKEVARLSNLYQTVDAIECYTKKLREVEKVIDLVDDVIVFYIDRKSESSTVCLDNDWWAEYIKNQASNYITPTNEKEFKKEQLEKSQQASEETIHNLQNELGRNTVCLDTLSQ